MIQRKDANHFRGFSANDVILQVTHLDKPSTKSIRFFDNMSPAVIRIMKVFLVTGTKSRGGAIPVEWKEWTRGNYPD
jgi:hypothetical protein